MKTIWRHLFFSFLITITISTPVVAQDSIRLPEEILFESGISYRYFDADGKAMKAGISFMYSQAGYITVELIGVLVPAGTIIADLNQSRLLTLYRDTKTFNVRNLTEFISRQDSVAKQDRKDLQVHATGKSAAIMGYKCHEYLLLNGDKKVLVWVTTEISSGISEFMRTYGNNSGVYTVLSAVPHIKGIENAIVMRVETEATRGSSIRMEAVALHNPNSINTSGYRLVSK